MSFFQLPCPLLDRRSSARQWLGAGVVESVTCAEIIEEFRETLIEKLSFSPERAAAAVEQVEKFSRVVAIPGTLSDVVPDPDDHKVLECAVAGGATHIVTGDKRHLLPLKYYQGIAIVSPNDFLLDVARSS
jgi:predicted nucleic acid-binding protein